MFWAHSQWPSSSRSFFCGPQCVRRRHFEQRRGGRLNIPEWLTCAARLFCWRAAEGYSEQLGSGYKWGTSISKVGKVAILQWGWLMWAQRACSRTHAEPSPTGSAATGRERKCIDPGGHSDKMLNNGGRALRVQVRVTCTNRRITCCCQLIFAFREQRRQYSFWKDFCEYWIYWGVQSRHELF